jgi:uncharacterized OB-fold protein
MAGRVPLKEGLLTTVDDAACARLVGGRCPECGNVNFPMQSLCPYCSSDGCRAVSLDPHGRLEVCTTVINRPPGYDGPLPFGFGVVELPEGIRIIARILEPERSHPGAAVTLVLETLHINPDGNEVVTYAFRPTSS